MIKFFITQTKAINLFLILVIIAGSYQFAVGQKEGFPNIGLDIITINTPYVGASADEIKTLITDRLESAIENITGSKKISSFSSEGISSIVFEVNDDLGIDADSIKSDIESAIESEKRELPPDAEDPIVSVISFTESFPNLVVGFIGDDIELLKQITYRFELDARKVSGVSKLEKQNYSALEVWVEIDPNKLEQFDLEISSVVRAIKAKNISIPAGKIELEGEQVFLKTIKKFKSLDDVSKTILRSNDVGKQILLEDIATVHFAYEEEDVLRRSKGRNGIWLQVFKSEKGDTIRVTDAVVSIIDGYKQSGFIPDSVSIIYSDDISFYVKRRLAVLSSNATIGLLFVFICLIVFYDYRITIWTSLGIPFSFCGALLIIYALGLTLNLMSMFGFIIVLGMLVDDAIVVSENIYSHIEKGEEYFSAALIGTKEIFYPVLAMISTSILAFLPLVTLPGIFGDVLGIIPQVVIVALACSLFESLFVLPGHLAHLKHKAKKTLAAGGQQASMKTKELRGWFTHVLKKYTLLLTFVSKRPFLSFAFIGLMYIGVAGFAFTKLDFVFFPGTAETIIVEIETPISNGLNKTQAVIDSVEKNVIEAFSDNNYLVDIFSIVGQDGAASRGNGNSYTQTHLGFVKAKLDTQRDISDAQLIKKIDVLLSKLPGIVSYEIVPIKGGPPAGRDLELSVFSENLATLNDISKVILEEISLIENIRSPASSFKTGKREIVISPLEQQAAILGISIPDIANAVKETFSGNASTSITSFASRENNGDDIDIVIKYSTNQGKTLDDIYNTPVMNKQGRTIPVRNFSDIHFESSSSRITKKDSKSFVLISADLKDERSKEFGSAYLYKTLNEKILTWEKQYPDVSFEYGGAKEEQGDLMFAIVRAVALALFSIYFVLTVVFRSYLQPLIVMSIVPFAFLGVLIGLFINNTAIGLMPFLGGVALTGVVVNDSLVMVDKINRLRRDENMDYVTATIKGASSRLRAIIMTSVTTIVGIVPLAYGLLGEEPFLAPMAIALAWGLFFATLLMLFMVPALYLTIENMMLRLSKIFGGNKKAA